ncbi:hypothetical protein MKW94_030575 [Papaver nudicaule]|uniref:Uncharacterized protein n=1 Tax=Papaver nudicaule TaxID=74823 RepID=A0AA41VKJ2_PAPNU|nr:hypothetical protein [Papaver nudicaule]
MGRLQKLINGLLLIYFLFMVIWTPLADVGHILGRYFCPDFSVPGSYIVLILVEHLLVWPLCVANFYGIFTGKSWAKKTCFIYGVGAAIPMVAILSEMIRSSGASSALSSIYVPLLGFALISVLNGLTG